MKIAGTEQDIYFGDVDADEGDWRTELGEEIDPDDEELENTPQDVIDMLGFDPKESSKDQTMNLNTVQALLILNAKKGWSDAARKASAAKRKQKAKVRGSHSIAKVADRELKKAAQAGVRLRGAALKAFELSKKAKTKPQHIRALQSHLDSKFRTGNEYRYDLHSTMAESHKKAIKTIKSLDRATRAGAKGLKKSEGPKPTVSAKVRKFNDTMKAKRKAWLAERKKKQELLDLDLDPNQLDESKRTPDRSPKDYYSMRFTGNAKKGWSDSARKASALKRKLKAKKVGGKSGETTPKVGKKSLEDLITSAEKKSQRLSNEAFKLYDKASDLRHESNQVWGKKSNALYEKSNKLMSQGDVLSSQAYIMDYRIKKAKAKLEARKAALSGAKGVTGNAKKGAAKGNLPPKPKGPKQNLVGGQKGWSDAARKKAAIIRASKKRNSAAALYDRVGRLEVKAGKSKDPTRAAKYNTLADVAQKRLESHKDHGKLLASQKKKKEKRYAAKKAAQSKAYKAMEERVAMRAQEYQ